MRSLAKLAAPALVVAGGVVVYLGYKASQSAASRFSELFTGQPTDRVMQHYILGAVLIALGIGAASVGFGKRGD